jgi:hypothetical protein
MRSLLLLAFLVFVPFALAQKQLAHSPRIVNAKTVYFQNTTGSDTVGSEALAALKKWGKYQVVPDKSKADLVFLLSADPYKGGNIEYSGGQTGSIDDNGHVQEDRVPNYTKASPTRHAYLSVIDPKTGENLWSDEHLWGGLLTGFNSVGARLIRELESQMKH